jgi:integrase
MLTVDKLIPLYLDRIATLRPPGRSTLQTLETIRHHLGKNRLPLSADEIEAFAQARRVTVTAATVRHDLAILGSFLRRARRLKLCPDPGVEAFQDALANLVDFRIAAPGAARTRAATPQELNILIAAAVQRGGLVRLELLIPFAFETTMRLGEICRATWSDVDLERRTILVRDRKDPRSPTGHDDLLPLTPAALAILAELPSARHRLFPYAPASVTCAFKRLATSVGLAGPKIPASRALRLHDLRRTGAQALMDDGLSSEEVAAWTGHRSMAVLHKHYARPNPEKLAARMVDIRPIAGSAGAVVPWVFRPRARP